MATNTVWDAVVVGLGGVGSFALRALAKEGKGGQFLGLERYTLGHGRGSSNGRTRIYRRAYFEHPNYVPWIEYSLGVFQELQSWSQQVLIQQCGTLLMEPAGSSIDAHQHRYQNVTAKDLRQHLPPLLWASWESAQLHHIPVEYLNHSNLVERFPQFYHNPAYSMVGLLEPGGGFIRCELAQEAALAQAMEESNNGNNSNSITIMEQYYLKGYQEFVDSSGTTLVELKVGTDDDLGRSIESIITTRCLLICAGGWAGQLLPAWAPHLRPTRQIQGWIDIKQQQGDDLGLYGHEKMPTFVMVTPDWLQPLYGVPCDSDDNTVWRRRLKVGIHGREVEIVDPSRNSHKTTPEEIHELQMATRYSIHESAWDSSQELVPRIVETKPCMYTMTPDCQYMIGVPDGYQRTFGVAGLSGHGFKNTPALGQMMADFALGKDITQWNFEFCSPSRFHKTIQ